MATPQRNDDAASWLLRNYGPPGTCSHEHDQAPEPEQAADEREETDDRKAS